MEEAEPVETELSTHDATIAELRTQIDDVEARLVVAGVRNWTWRSSGWRQNQQPPPQPCPNPLLATYSDLRSGLDEVAIARLNGARCEGCGPWRCCLGRAEGTLPPHARRLAGGLPRSASGSSVR